MKKFVFPIINRVQISHFTLYKRTDFLDIDLSKEVYCLAGANGLGKSTFITIINYGLTGIVKNPERRFTWFNEISKFYNQSKSFASTYFDGRVSEENYELAEVTIEFSLNEINYVITRGFFEPDQLRKFERISPNNQIEISADLNGSELDLLFKQSFTKDVNLANFDQFVFLQSYVFTFDESHQLLFWDESIIERVLYLVFGVNAEKAKLADKYRKEYNRYDSEFRNIQWNITKIRNEVNHLKKISEEQTEQNDEGASLHEEYLLLLEKNDQLIELIESRLDDIKECDLSISDFSLQVSSLRSQYESIFNSSLQTEVSLEKKPEIINILNDLKLRIYASKNYDDLLVSLVAFIMQQKEEEENKQDDEYFIILQNLDEQLVDITKKIENLQNRKNRIIEENETTYKESKVIKDKINKILNDNEDTIRRHQNKTLGDSSLDSIINRYNEDIVLYTQKKDEIYNKRHKTKEELNSLEKELSQGYINAESIFIPIFNDYAKSFLGLDLSIQLSNSVKGPNLSLYIQNSKRKDSFQLSESQRYFIDIALRMALIEFSTCSATMLIDTPEGSLDIAYESRAGKMFAEYAKGTHKVIMTANINSSQLLLELASLCTDKKMLLERMTNWTYLSDVQQAENDRIEEAYMNIESKLSSL